MPLEYDPMSKKYFLSRLGEMERVRSSFTSHYLELQSDIKPRRGQFLRSNVNQSNRGEKRHQRIINSIGTQSLRIATAGMFNGIMSPARPWFALSPIDIRLKEFEEVKIYLDIVQRVMLQIFNRGNLYDMTPQMIEELLLFGTGCMLHLEDELDVSRFYTQTVGSYYLGQNNRLEVDTFARQIEYTAYQMMMEFPDRKSRSDAVNSAIDKGEYSKVFNVYQFIEKNPKADQRKARVDSRYKPYRSVHFESGATAGFKLNTGSDGTGGTGSQGADNGKFLRVSGFDEFPVYAPRWDVTGNDVYGTDCPGMVALGDIRGLQVQEKRKAQAIDKMVNPPLTGPPSVRNVPISSLPGGVNIYSASGNQKLESLYEVRLDIQNLRLDMSEVERRIQKAFYVDMFLAISNMEGIQPKNQLELSQRNEERLLQLGPTLQRFQREFQRKLIERTFNQANRLGILPEPPQQLDGVPLKIEYLSTLAMAQQAIKTQELDRLTIFAGELLNLGFEDAALKYNAEQAIDVYAEALGVPPGVVRPDEIVQALRQQREEARQLQAMAENVKPVSEAAKNANEILESS